MHVHGISEIPDDPFGAQPAGFDFVGIAPFAVQHLLIAHRHAAPADPVLAVARVNVVVIRQRCQNIRSVAAAIRDLLD